MVKKIIGFSNYYIQQFNFNQLNRIFQYGENYVEKDILRKGNNSRLYSLKINLNLGITYYTKKLKKLYEMLSEIFQI